jgi:hypothetical protein
MKKGLTVQEKLTLAQELGISTMGLGSSSGLVDEPELDRRIQEAERAAREENAQDVRTRSEQHRRSELSPWPVIVTLLFEKSSDDVVDIIGLSGLSVDWSLSAKESYSHGTRKRVYRPRIDTAYAVLDEAAKLRVAWVVASELLRRDESVRGRLALLLDPVGWGVSSEGLRPKNADIQELFFPGGMVHDAYVEIRRILKSAARSITIVDPYLDDTLFPLLGAVEGSISIRLLTWKTHADFAREMSLFLAQHKRFSSQVRYSREFHDRFIIVDGARCYHVGSSLKDAGRRAFMISPLEDVANLEALRKQLEQTWETADEVPPN